MTLAGFLSIPMQSGTVALAARITMAVAGKSMASLLKRWWWDKIRGEEGTRIAFSVKRLSLLAFFQNLLFQYLSRTFACTLHASWYDAWIGVNLALHERGWNISVCQDDDDDIFISSSVALLCRGTLSLGTCTRGIFAQFTSSHDSQGINFSQWSISKLMTGLHQ